MLPGTEAHLSLVTSAGEKFAYASVDLFDESVLNNGIEWLTHGVKCMPAWTYSPLNGRAVPATAIQARLFQARGSALLERFTYWSNQLDDLAIAIDDLQTAVDYAESPSAIDSIADPERGWWHYALAQALASKANLTSRADLFADAIEQFEAAVPLAPHAARAAQYRAGLSYALSDRFRLADRHPRLEQDRQDFERAISELRAAVDDAPDDDADAVGRRINLGLILLERYELGNDHDDVESAVDLVTAAIESGSDEDPGRVRHLAALGDALRLRHALTSSDADLDGAIGAYRAACSRGAARGSRATFSPAHAWMKWAGERGAWHEAAEAGDYGLRAFSATRTNELRRDYKEVWLREGDGLAAEGAYAHARAGNPTNAVIALEEHRAVVLRERFPNVAEHLEALSAVGRDELRSAYTDAARALADETAPTEALRAKADELHQIVEQIQETLGLAQFSPPPTLTDIRRSASDLPLVYLLASRFGGLAIIVRSTGDAQTLWFPRLDILTARRLFELMSRDVHSYNSTPLLRRRAINHVCEQLGSLLMADLDAALAEDEPVILVPTGILALLPLHAASWDTRGRRTHAIERRRWTYTPSAHALRRSDALNARAAIERVLAVADPQPVTATALAGAVDEVEAIKRAFGARLRTLPHENATADAVRKAISHSQLVHLACHCRADLREPLESALLLAHDERLTLAELLELDLRHVTLTILSACQTSVTGSGLPDEATSLAAGLLFAGSSGVIGSLWPVPDEATAAVMRRFYAEWDEEQPHAGDALRAAQLALLNEKDSRLQPYFWGGFAYLGA
jgi:CHAT domain-containing protein